METAVREKRKSAEAAPENAFEAFFADRTHEGLRLTLPLIGGVHAFVAAAYWFTAPYEQAASLAAFSLLVTVAAGSATVLLARREARFLGADGAASCVVLLALCCALVNLAAAWSPLAAAMAAVLAVVSGVVCSRPLPLAAVHVAMHSWCLMLASADGWSASWLQFETALITATAAAWGCYHQRRSSSQQLFETRRLLGIQAQRDPLTNLPMRSAVMDRLDERFGRLRRNSGVAFGLCVLNLDGFRKINEQHGHAIGDLVLQNVAERLRLACRRSDVVARLGGDEFVILLDETPTPEHADAGADRLCGLSCAPIDLDGLGLTVSASYGAVWSGSGFESPEAMLGAAHKEMHASKARYRAVARAVAVQKRVQPRRESVALASIA